MSEKSQKGSETEQTCNRKEKKMVQRLENSERIYVELPKFTGRNVKINELAKATGKDPNYIRVGLQQGFLKFGIAVKMEGSSEYNYYCPDKKVWEETGYFHDPNESLAAME